MQQAQDRQLSQLLLSGIETLSARYGVKIIFTEIFDTEVLGGFSENPSLNTLLSRFDFHDNVFCNIIKKDASLFSQCIACKKRVERKCMEIGGPFGGECHMGLYEYIFPIFHNRILLAYLSVGEFAGKPNFLKLEQVEQEKGMPRGTLSAAFRSVISPPPENLEHFWYDFQTLSALFSYLFAHFLQSGGETLYDHPIVNKTIFYILTHYRENLPLESIARHCFCNKNYLCELFYRVTGKHLNHYINELRIRKAAQFMRTGDRPVGKIALECGFSNISYFSTVFKKYTGLSPTAYKLNILKEKP